MDIVFSKIFIIRNNVPDAVVGNFQNDENVSEYIETITTDFVGNNVSREYQFDETCLTTKNDVTQIIKKISSIQEADEDVVDNLKSELNEYIKARPAQRLSSIEKNENNSHPNIGQIPKGVLIVADVLTNAGEKQLILVKADYTEFVEEQSGDKKLGLPIKKKIYKAASFDYSFNPDTETCEFTAINVCDTSNRDAKYWWKNFLELREIRTNEDNTINAYESIKKKIINPIKRDSKADFMGLYNFNLAYFSTNDQFNIEDYIEKFEAYQRVDTNWDREKTVEKLRRLPDSCNFDRTFEKVPTSITDKKKRETINLAENIELTIKDKIENMRTTISAGTDDEGRKYVKILSEEGYSYFKNRNM